MPNLLSSDILSILTTVGVVAVGIGYIADRLLTGRKQHATDVDNAQEKLIKTLTEQLQAQQQINDSLKGANEALKQQMTEQMHELQGQMNSLTAEVNRLKGLNEANERKIQEYLQIITNRNPDLDKTLTTITGVIQDVLPFMNEMRESHAALRAQLDALHPKGRHPTAPAS